MPAKSSTSKTVVPPSPLGWHAARVAPQGVAPVTWCSNVAPRADGVMAYYLDARVWAGEASGRACYLYAPGPVLVASFKSGGQAPAVCKRLVDLPLSEMVLTPASSATTNAIAAMQRSGHPRVSDVLDEPTASKLGKGVGVATRASLVRWTEDVLARRPRWAK